MTDTDHWPYCPSCGSGLEKPAGPYREWADCPNCGEVHIEFHRSSDADTERDGGVDR